MVSRCPASPRVCVMSLSGRACARRSMRSEVKDVERAVQSLISELQSRTPGCPQGLPRGAQAAAGSAPAPTGGARPHRDPAARTVQPTERVHRRPYGCIRRFRGRDTDRPPTLSTVYESLHHGTLKPYTSPDPCSGDGTWVLRIEEEGRGQEGRGRDVEAHGTLTLSDNEKNSTGAHLFIARPST